MLRRWLCSVFPELACPCDSPALTAPTPAPPPLRLQLDFDGMEEGGEGALGGAAGGDEDDFEAQMRALEEGL